MATIRPKVRVPKTAAKGDTILIKTLISHPMESGVRKNKAGELIPRDIIKRFEARFEGELFFSTDMHPAISADPYFAFYFKVPGPGSFTFKWIDDAGKDWTITKSIAVS
jgi:sulfur-oxidizing protein SoxZ